MKKRRNFSIPNNMKSKIKRKGDLSSETKKEENDLRS
jgi:hypothetical protein